MKKKYLSNKELYMEIVYCKEIGKLTKHAEQMLILLAKNVVKKMYYSNSDDKLDCLQTAYLSVFSNWSCFDTDKGDNAFAYYTEIIKRGLAQGWNKLYKFKGDEDNKIKFISLQGLNDDGSTYDRF